MLLCKFACSTANADNAFLPQIHVLCVQDIQDCMFDFCKDQFGSRYIQSKLEDGSANAQVCAEVHKCRSAMRLALHAGL